MFAHLTVQQPTAPLKGSKDIGTLVENHCGRGIAHGRNASVSDVSMGRGLNLQSLAGLVLPSFAQLSILKHSRVTEAARRQQPWLTAARKWEGKKPPLAGLWECDLHAVVDQCIPSSCKQIWAESSGDCPGQGTFAFSCNSVLKGLRFATLSSVGLALPLLCHMDLGFSSELSA